MDLPRGMCSCALSNGAMSAQSLVGACLQSKASNLIHIWLAGCAKESRACNQIHIEHIFRYLNIGQMLQIWTQWCGTALREPSSVLSHVSSSRSQIKVMWLSQEWTSCFLNPCHICKMPCWLSHFWSFSFRPMKHSSPSGRAFKHVSKQNSFISYSRINGLLSYMKQCQLKRPLET